MRSGGLQFDQTRLQTRSYRKGETLIRAGSELSEWIAISKGAVCLSTVVSGEARVAVAALWFGDVIGSGSPLGKSIAGYNVSALVDVETIALPYASHSAAHPAEAAHLYTSTALRLNRQIGMRLAGNGPQRFLSVLSTLASALVQRTVSAHQPLFLSVPIGQACLGQLAGLSRRQVWIYLGQLSDAGWIRTARTRIDLVNLACWLQLPGEVENLGLASIATIEKATATMSSLNRRTAAA